jgi:hypothetical protein
MERFVLVQERLIGLSECSYSNCLVEVARRTLLIVRPMSGSGDRWCLGALEVLV